MKTQVQFLLAFLCMMLPAIVPASQGAISSCQTVKDRIEQYSDKRRHGGSVRQMESWKRSRDHYAEKYTQYNCVKWRTKLQ